MTDPRLRKAAEALDAGPIARREFLRNAAVITGGTAAGLHVLKDGPRPEPPSSASGSSRASSPPATTSWPSRSRRGPSERKVNVETDWATFGDREQKVVAAIEAGNPPDMAEMNTLGPMRYKAALRDVSRWARTSPDARGGMLPHAESSWGRGKYLGVPRAMIPADSSSARTSWTPRA